MSYLAPTDLSDALTFLEETGATIIAGCTDYYPSRTQSQLQGPVLDVTRLAGLRGIELCAGHWRIGAATTWTDILRADLPPAFEGLRLAAREVGSIQIQNRGTLAGNLCNASPAADGVPPLLALETSVELVSKNGTRTLPLSEFITGVRRTDLQPGEMMSALLVPTPSDGSVSSFLKLGSRTHLVISIAMVAACLTRDGDRITQANIAVGSCSPVAQRLPALEQRLVGATSIDVAGMDFAQLDVWAPLSPISDVRGTSEYRADAVAQLCQRSVLLALG